MRFLLLSAFILFSTPLVAQSVSPNINTEKVTVSGVSSGAFMAQQLHVAYSDIFSGMGSVAGGPFFCAQNMPPEDIATIKQQCMMGIGADLTAATYVEKARTLAQSGEIASLDNLADDKVFIFNSQSDQVINPLLGNASRLFYDSFVQDQSDNIKAWAYIPTYGPFYPVAHGMPTNKSLFDGYENFTDMALPCSPSNSQQYSWFPNQFMRGNDPWMYHCNYGLVAGYDLADDILSHLYGKMAQAEKTKDENLYHFAQLDFVSDLATTQDLNDHGIGSTAYAYVPDNCKSGETACKLHVALHGCQQFPEWTFNGKVGSSHSGEKVTFGDLFYKNIYNGLAEANDIIVVYPQAHNIGTAESDTNPYGCWAFWAFSNDEIQTYYTREGREMKMIANIVEAFKNKTIQLQQN